MVTKERMDALKERYCNARSQKELDAIREEMKQLCDEDVESVGRLAVEQIRETRAEAETLLVRDQLEKISPMVSMSYIAKTYFNKSRGWLCQRINGLKVNGKRAEFTEEEKKILSHALNDMGRQLSEVRIS